MNTVLDLPIAALASSTLRAAGVQLVLASAVCAVVWLACRALGKHWPALQQALWVLVLVRLVLPPGLAQPYGVGALLGRLGLGYPWDGASDPTMAWLPDGGPTADTATIATPPAADAWSLPVLAFWALGVGVLSLQNARRSRDYRLILRQAAQVQDASVIDLCDQWRRRLGIRRRVELRTSDAPVAPFTAGLWRPVVFLPRTLFAQADGCGVATALGHELGHVARWDVLWMCVQRAIERLYFFHPAVWVASRQLHAGREQLCDALVVERGLTTAREYVDGLLNVLQLHLRGVSAPALTPSQRRIVVRVHAVLSVRAGRRSRPGLVLGVTVLVGSFLLPLASADVKEEPSPAVASASAAETQREPDAPESSTLAWAHGLANPLPGGRLRSGFGRRLDPTTQHRVFHPGLDISAPLGTPILAPADGRVTLLGEKGAYGKVLALDHATGVVTRYSHLSSFNVRAGQRVRRGEVIAFVGETGRSLGPHLHYEVWIRNESRNPLK